MDDKPLLLLLLLLFFELSELFLPIGLNRDDNSANAIYIYRNVLYIRDGICSTWFGICVSTLSLDDGDINNGLLYRGGFELGNGVSNPFIGFFYCIIMYIIIQISNYHLISMVYHEYFQIVFSNDLETKWIIKFFKYKYI